jgi:polyhydroxyalkanoate synthesis regulator phasin
MGKRKILVGFILVFTVTLSSFSFYFWQVVSSPNILVDQENRYLYIPSNATFKDIQNILYNEKYVNSPFKAGKELLEDVRKDPRKVYDGLVDDGLDFVKGIKKDAQKTAKDGKKLVKDLRKAPRKVFDDFVDDAKEYVGDVRKDARKTMDGFVDNGKNFFEGAEKDARKVIDDFLDSGKKAFKKFPMVETVEKKVNSGMKAVPSQLNLPSKKDIDKLTRSVKTLNNKVDNLSKQYAA